jgi:hypothetical protein
MKHKSLPRSKRMLSQPDEAGVFIRDCFDELFYFFERLEYCIAIGLITFEDVRFPWEYYAGVLGRNKAVFLEYNRPLYYERAIAFLERFQDWSKAPKNAAA